MGRNMFHSVVDWDEIEALRSQFRCESRTDSRDGGLAIQVEGRPFVPVCVNGEGPFTMVFETGHCAYTLSNGVRDLLGLKQDSRGMMAMETFSIGGTCWHGIEFGADKMDDIGEFLHHRVDGLLGNLFWMLQCVTPTLDYPGEQLYIAPDEDDLTSGPRNHWVPMEIFGLSPFVSAVVNGQGPFRFHVDTGAGASLLSEEASKRLGLELGDPARLRGTLIDDPARAATLESLSVGGAEIRDLGVKVSLATLLIEKNTHSSVDGVIGTSFLKHFVVTFDYARERFGLSSAYDQESN